MTATMSAPSKNGSTVETQKNRLLELTTDLGDQVLLVQAAYILEGISCLFRWNLQALSRNRAIDFSQIVGKTVSLRLGYAGKGERYLNGIVSRFTQTGSDATFAHYNLEVVPWLWFLTRTSDCRIFQRQTVPEIVAQVFQDERYFKNKISNSRTKPPAAAI